jgi:cytochrome oxidase assembly protein ShyY1
MLSLIESRTAALRASPVDLDDYLASRRSEAANATGSGSGGNDAASVSSVGVDECKRLRVRGRLLHERTMLLGPRTPPSSDGTSTAGQGSGYYLLTPLRLNDGRMLLVNRGWCPLAQCTRGSQGHVETTPSEDEVEVIGVIRKGEAEPSFLNNYDPIKTGAFVWLDLRLMARFSGVNEAPVTVDPPSDVAAAAAAVGSEGASSSVLLLDALEISGSGPGSRHMRRRGEGHYLVFSTTPMVHAVYAATWFTLAAALTALTFIRFGKKGQQKAAQQALKIARNKQTRFQ